MSFTQACQNVHSFVHTSLCICILNHNIVITLRNRIQHPTSNNGTLLFLVCVVGFLELEIKQISNKFQDVLVRIRSEKVKSKENERQRSRMCRIYLCFYRIIILVVMFLDNYWLLKTHPKLKRSEIYTNHSVRARLNSKQSKAKQCNAKRSEESIVHIIVC